MKRDDVLGEVRQLLTRTGFFSPEARLFASPVFDIVARRDASLVVVKCLLNGDALTSEVAGQLLQVAGMLRGSPLVVAARSSRGALEDGVVYLRHGTPLVSLKTIRDFLLEGVPPVAFAGPGGYFVPVDSGALRRARQLRHLSLEALAREAGVSRRAIQLYEEGMSAAVDAADRLERFFGESITFAIDPFTYHLIQGEPGAAPESAQDDFEAYVLKALEGMGYKVLQAARCPFDALVEKPGSRILSGIESHQAAVPGRSRTLAAIARVAETDAVMFVPRELKKETIGGTPVVTRRELQRADSGDSIIEIIKQRRKEA
jgi:putative transcriptional regulator